MARSTLSLGLLVAGVICGESSTAALSRLVAPVLLFGSLGLIWQELVRRAH